MSYETQRDYNFRNATFTLNKPENGQRLPVHGKGAYPGSRARLLTCVVTYAYYRVAGWYTVQGVVVPALS
ncbi:hypothetical protein LSAT2_005752 [Lamellibrachia satsuma]|nr:hypothetical protein LSAT2_005752 [Lamellibrachia satsuma]